MLTWFFLPLSSPLAHPRPEHRLSPLALLGRLSPLPLLVLLVLLVPLALQALLALEAVEAELVLLFYRIRQMLK
ncbi:MAG: hypothetical protein HW419_711 [Deltaproteobacteria bacterium]|nr:hypothetical protein [Deltaproteobacteria bacterium]